MIAIIKKEINSFFSSAIGYFVIALFLLINGLFLWVFKGGFNILDSGFAALEPFFELCPWVLLFLIPAVTMRAFSDELKMGTLELLLTKPIAIRDIVLGKYFGAIALICIALTPTLLYIITISTLGNPAGNFDLGSTIGSYVGLLFLIFAFTAIGIFASSLSSNQIVAFMIAILVSFIFYYGFDAVSETVNSPSYTRELGFKHHFDSVARGVIDTRDLIYFISIAILFLGATVLKLKSAK
ncbi:MAG: ABC-2 type transport system permease protein [Patiriisocius sp.]|jgi:ABC-2 type transport system permease protein